MLGNPYSSTRPELGSLTRETKNKICTNCELVARLEDDGGMEHLDGWRKYKWQEEVQRKMQHECSVGSQCQEERCSHT